MQQPPPILGKPLESWLSRNAKWFLPVICVGAVLLFAGFAAGLGGVIFGFMKSSDAYKEAVARAKAEPAVVQALGSPIREGFFVTGRIKVNGTSGKANLAIPISGPNGKATIYVAATKSQGQWTFQHLIVEIEKTRKKIDISDQKRRPDALERTEVRTVVQLRLSTKGRL